MNVFLITFSCYGDHLPGDDRGSFDHVRNGGSRFLAPNPALHQFARAQMKQEPFTLRPEAREVVRDTIVRVCRYRSWPLRALHVRTTHLHGVVEAPSAPNVINSWKAYATRELRAQGLATQDQRVWAHSGNSTIVHPNRIETTIRYILINQGEPMATFPLYDRSAREPCA